MSLCVGRYREISYLMRNIQHKPLTCNQELDLKKTLIYKGKIAAIKQVIRITRCRVDEAKQIVEKIAQQIEPGPAYGLFE